MERSLAQVADDGTTASLLVMVFQPMSYQAWWKPSLWVRWTSVLKRLLRRGAVRSSALGPAAMMRPAFIMRMRSLSGGVAAMWGGVGGRPVPCGARRRGRWRRAAVA